MTNLIEILKPAIDVASASDWRVTAGWAAAGLALAGVEWARRRRKARRGRK